MAEQKYFTNLHSFKSGKTEIKVDRENNTVTVSMPSGTLETSEEMRKNGFSLVDSEYEDEFTQIQEWTASLNEITAAHLEKIRSRVLSGIDPDWDMATTQLYPENEALCKDGWIWTDYDDGSGGLANKNRPEYSAHYDAITHEAWTSRKGELGGEYFVYSNPYEGWDIEQVRRMAEEKVSEFYGVEENKRFGKEIREFRKFTEKRQSEAQHIQKAFEIALYKNPARLVEMPLTRENYNRLYPEGYVETVKLGQNQFEKLQKADRRNLLFAAYQTLSTPSIVLDLLSIDRTDNDLKPIHVYGKSFYREETGNKRIVESVIIFRDGESISIGVHNKDAERFSKQIKTADDIIFADKEVSRVASLILKYGGSHVRLDGINTEAINSRYNIKHVLSTKNFGEKGENKIENASIILGNTVAENTEDIEEVASVVEYDPSDGFPIDFVPPEEKLLGYDENGEPIYESGFLPVDETKEPSETVRLQIPKSIYDAIYNSAASSAIKALYGENYMIGAQSSEVYAREIHSILYEFSCVDYEDWNTDRKTDIRKLMELSELGKISLENSVQKIRDFFVSETTRNKEFISSYENLAEFFSKIIMSRKEKGYEFSFSARLISLDKLASNIMEAQSVKGYVPSITQEQVFPSKMMLEIQHDDFFRLRKNIANNFFHNLAVRCRTDCDSPLDAITVAKQLVKDMSLKERRKTKGLLESRKKDGETMNQVVVAEYFNAIKQIPPNGKEFGRAIDGVSGDDTTCLFGEKIDRNYRLRVGDAVRDIAFKTGKIFGIGKECLMKDCTVVSASQKRNILTLMDSDGSFYNVKMDKFLKRHSLKEQDEHTAQKRKELRVDIER